MPKHGRSFRPLTYQATRWGKAVFCALAVISVGFSACRNDGPVQPSVVAEPLTVHITPRSSTLAAGATLPLSAQVLHWKHDSTVTWSIVQDPSNEDLDCGAITASGSNPTFSAPKIVSASVELVTIRARSNEDTTRYALCVVTVLPTIDTTSQAQIRLVITPSSATILTGKSLQLQAAVSGTQNTDVAWKLMAGPGTLSATGLYTAPMAVVGPHAFVAVEASSLADPTVKMQCSLTVEPPAAPCFQSIIQPMIVSNCGVSGCHNPVDRTAGIDFTTYDGLMVKVVPGDTAHSPLYFRVLHVLNPLRKDQIAQIGQWILGGAPNSTCGQGMSGCDTTNVHFSTYIKPEIANYCVGCHSGTHVYTSAGVDLSTFAGIQSVALSGQLSGAICHLPSHPQMPKYCAQLDSCTVSKIISWIDRGAPND